MSPFIAQKPPISPIEKSRRRAKQNERTGRKLGEIAAKLGDVSAEVTADLLCLSANEKANGELTNLIDKKGRVFSCPQALISANSRLDTNYQIKTARRHRKRIYEAFTAHLPDVIESNYGICFLTPTFPNLRGVGFAQNDAFQAKAWELFLQTKIFGEFFHGGFFKTEWTLGGSRERKATGRAFDLDRDGINYHCHILAINRKPFADGETSQLENELAAANKGGTKTAADKRLLRNSLRIVSAWTVCLQKAHREIFGKSLKIDTKSGLARFEFQAVSTDEIKAYDGEESRNGIFWEIAKTANYTAKAGNYSKLPPELLLEAENVFRGKRIINAFGVFRKYVETKSETRQPLVNQPTKQSENCLETAPNSLFDDALRGEKESLKNYGIRLCSTGRREIWLRYLARNRDLIIADKRDALLKRFPRSVFTDLSGKSYYGWQAERTLKGKDNVPFMDYKTHVLPQFLAGKSRAAFQWRRKQVSIPRLIH